MQRLAGALGLIALGGCSDARHEARATPPPPAELANSDTQLQSLRATFNGIFERSEARGWTLFDERLVPFGATTRASLPLHADGEIHLGDSPRPSVNLRLVGARSVRARTASGFVVYPAAAPGGGDLVVRAGAFGVEDFVVIDSPAEPSTLDYEVSLEQWTAGLRLVGNSLELLDDAGAPRIRMQAPWLVDTRGTRRAVQVGVDGCFVDTSWKPPFRRAVLPPGSRRCVVHLAWNPSGLEHPIVVDPGWMSTSALNTPRYQHIATTLPSGDVLVAGGLMPDPVATEVATDTVEIFSNGAWAAAAPMAARRAMGASATLANGDVLVTGGFDQDLMGQTILGTTEIYSPASGTWSAAGNLVTPRAGHTATAVGDGTVLVAAGFDNSGDHFTNAELFSAGTFSPAGDINTTRFFHVAVGLPNHRVLLGGGTDPYSGALGSLELWTAGVGWSKASALAEMAVPRTLLAATVLADGDVLFAGGYNADDATLSSIERYRPSTNTWTSNAGQLSQPRYDSVAALLPDGRALFIGGQTLTAHHADADLFDPLTNNVLRVPGMSARRAFGHTATVLSDGRVLVAGGYQAHDTSILASTDLFDLTADGGAELPPEPTPEPNDDGPSDAGPSTPVEHPDGGVPSDEPDAGVVSPEPPDSSPAPIAVLGAGGSGCTASAAANAGSWVGLAYALLGTIVRRQRARRWR